MCVYHRGRKVVDVWGGRRDQQGRPWEEDTMAMSFSTSKGVVSTLIHILADRALLDYDDPVARHWPEFAQAGKQDITIRDVLTHRAGLPGIRSLIDGGERILDWNFMVEALARATPMLRPGSTSAYHALTYGWLAGEIVQRVAGRPLPQVLREELAEPLGLDGLYIGAPPSAIARAATLPSPVARLQGIAPWLTSRPLMRTLSLSNADMLAILSFSEPPTIPGPATITTQGSATAVLDQIDTALQTVTSERAAFGALQNRFEAVITNLQVSAENQTAARSRIMDADFAAETAALTRAQVLQQAGTAMLAQANQIPSNVLRLLQG